MKLLSKATVTSAAIGIALLTAGCATKDDMRLIRQPEMPLMAVPKASRMKNFYKNVSIQEVYGAPEFRWFDGGAVLTTRPTRVQVLRFLETELENADMLAPTRQDSEYLLYVNFAELKGPNVWIGSDKLASARVTFRLVRWRTGQVVREQTIETSYRAKFPGIAPDVVRAAIAGPIGVTRDSAVAPIGGALGGATYAFLINDAVRVNIGSSSNLSNFEAALAGGYYGALIDGMAVAETMPTGAAEGEYFDGTRRRKAATDGLLNLMFDQFLVGLSKDGEVVFKQAVSCRAINPGSYFYRVTETEEAVGVDCPGAKYFASPSQRPKPSLF